MSATNNAQIYNLEHQASIESFPRYWSNRPQLITTLVWDAFFFFALLRECNDRQEMLVLAEDGTQAERLKPALMARNTSYVGPGRENYNHVCNKCMATQGEVANLRK